MGFLFKKEYRLGLLLVLVFGLFLYYADQTSEQIITYFTNTMFQYEKPAYLKLVYLVLLIVTIAMLATLNRSEISTIEEKKDAFNSFVISSVSSFFPGWIVHLYFVVQTVENRASFMELEDQFWIYHCADLTFVAGFAFAGFMKLRPAIHK
ncbi:hypothetical protein ERX46_02985 [Brumimicrobium glaciale]|uniref:Uncharacterized protein n=1 Tax=Brumimicrobium glaciale TaxID=200475 RepID=A0A4Q4KRE4_9FLAO|nr:hypothetical protein [Brumimicrobium glaciale]RYM35977.1 hypothetical protein ERX46_02985 [Brumimicrobium glaciale]